MRAVASGVPDARTTKVGEPPVHQPQHPVADLRGRNVGERHRGQGTVVSPSWLDLHVADHADDLAVEPREPDPVSYRAAIVKILARERVAHNRDAGAVLRVSCIEYASREQRNSQRAEEVR